MSPEIREKLLRHDIAAAYPPDFDWNQEVLRLRQLLPLLESVLNTPLNLDTSAEDASFFADIGVLVEKFTPQGASYFRYRYCFRFSCFGRLFTIIGEDVQLDTLEPAIRLLTGNGYSFIPESELYVVYDGVSPSDESFTWWIRFFDYL